jgi:hypothetical protein
MKNTTILATLACAASTAFAGVTAPPPPVVVQAPDPCAGPISYNNVELLYAYSDYDRRNHDLTDADFGSNNGDGLILRMEYSDWDNFYIVGGTAYHEADSVDIWSLTGGFGAYVALSENVHLVGEAGALWSSWDGEDYWIPDGSSDPNGGYWDSGEDDDFGWYFRPHLRGKWGCFETHLGATYGDVGGDFHDEWAGFVNLYYQVSPGWDLTAGVTFGSDTTMVTGGARYRY